MTVVMTVVALLFLIPAAAFATETADEPATARAEGGRHGASLGTGVAWSWGANTFGQLGYGTQIDSNRPFPVAGIDSITAVTGGYSSAYALRRDGTVWAWGYNGNGQLGDGTGVSSGSPVQVVGLDDVTAVAAGGGTAYALRRDGTVWAWGVNWIGQLGNGTNAGSDHPVQVIGLTDATAIAGGGTSGYAVLRDGTTWAWGNNTNGQLGDGTAIISNSPVQVIGLDEVTAVAAGEETAYALRRDGTVRAWGHNYSGQLGNGTTTDSTTPVQVAGLDEVTSIGAGSSTGYALREDATVWAWGGNYSGQLGDGTNTNSFTPVQVAVPTPVTSVAANGGYAIGGPRRSQEEIPPTARLTITPTRDTPVRITADAAGSVPGTAPLASFAFDFGDGTIVGPGTEATATHLYLASGAYQVTLTVTDATGAAAQRTTTVPITVPNTPGIFWEQTSSAQGPCNRCYAIKVVSTGAEPLVISGITPAVNSSAYIVGNDCTEPLAIGDFCQVEVGFSAPPPEMNTDIAIYHNAPGGVTIV